MTEHHTPATPQRVLGDSRGERTIVALIGSSVLALALTGMYVSFRTVYTYVLPYFHGTAWAVPSGVDLAILVFSAADLMLMYWDIPMPGLRMVPWAFTAATIALNWQAGGPLPIRIAHAAMPSLWVIFCEYARHVIRHRVGLVAGTRMEKIRKSRWFLAPWSTARMWRRMILWEITNYRAGLDMEADRLTRRALLEIEYGRRWRRKAPATKLLPLKLGALAPADTLSELTRTGLLDLDFGAIGQPNRGQIQAPAQSSAPAPALPQAQALQQPNPLTALPPGQVAEPAQQQFQAFGQTAGPTQNQQGAGQTPNPGHSSSAGPGPGQISGQIPHQVQPHVNGFANGHTAAAANALPLRDAQQHQQARQEQERQEHERREQERRAQERRAREQQDQARYEYEQAREQAGRQEPPRHDPPRYDLALRFAAPPAHEGPDHEEPEPEEDDFEEDFIPVRQAAVEPAVVIGKQRQQFEEELDRMIRDGDHRILSSDMRELTAAAWDAAQTLDLALAGERAARYGAEYRDRILAKGLTMELADALGLEWTGER